MKTNISIVNGCVLCLSTLCFALNLAAKTLEYTGDAVPGAHPLPEECENPFVESRPFFEFYEATIASMAVERGAESKGVAELFAVSELAEDLVDLVPNNAEESPIDRLVRSQICHYQEVFEKKRDPRVKTKVAATSNDSELHDHLSKIAPQLFKDSIKIVESVLMKQAKDDKVREDFRRKMANVKKARRLGRAKIDDSL
ncbi:hypothetical protein GW915_04310 [bacterium]|nr:hypothetical protein [bacterium]